MPRGLPFALAASLLAGCGGAPPAGLPLRPVGGTVLAADGRPLPGGVVLFCPDGSTDTPSESAITPDGTFAGLAPPGSYRVVVQPHSPEQPDEPGLRRLIPPRYRSLRDTPLTADVRPKGANTFEFRLR